MRSSDKPALVIIAGPNGSGKSTAYSNAKLEWEERDIWIINPDLLTLRLKIIEDLKLEEANLAAVTRIENWLNASIDVHQPIGVETVLSTDKYRKLVKFSKSKGFEFWLIYVALDSPERNVERVALRVQKGGHAVPESKIRDRYWRSLEQMKWFFDAADRAWVFDNSAAELGIVATKVNGMVTLHRKGQDPLDKALSDMD